MRGYICSADLSAPASLCYLCGYLLGRWLMALWYRSFAAVRALLRECSSRRPPHLTRTELAAFTHAMDEVC
jgi:hypothetical protein